MTTFLFVNALSPSGPFSFQYPDFFTHPNGRCGFDHAHSLINIIQPSSLSAMDLHCSTSSPYTTAESPKSLSLAILIESSRSFDFMMLATGQNIFSL